MLAAFAGPEPSAVRLRGPEPSAVRLRGPEPSAVRLRGPADDVAIERARLAILEARPGDAVAMVADVRRSGWFALHTWLDACEAAGLGAVCVTDVAGGPGWEGLIAAWHLRRADPDAPFEGDDSEPGRIAAAWVALEAGGDPGLEPGPDLHPHGWRALLRAARRDADDAARAELGLQALRAIPEHPEVLAELFFGRDEGPATLRAQRKVVRGIRRRTPRGEVALLRQLRLASVAGEREWAERLADGLVERGLSRPDVRPPWSPAMERAMANALASTRDPRVNGPTAPDRLAVASALSGRLVDAGRLEEAEGMWADARALGDSSSAAAEHASVLIALGRGDAALKLTEHALDLVAGPAWDDVGRLDRTRWASEIAEVLTVHARALEATGRDGAFAASLAARVLPSERTSEVVAEVGEGTGDLGGAAGRAVALILAEDADLWRAQRDWAIRHGHILMAEIAAVHVEALEGAGGPRVRAVRDAWGEAPQARNAAGIAVGDRFPVEAFGREIGAPLVVSAWASWCGPCRQELPALDVLVGELGLPAIALSVDEQESTYRRALARYGLVNLQPLRDPRLGASLQVGALPTLWLVDADGLLVARRVGWSEDALDAVRALAAEGK